MFLVSIIGGVFILAGLVFLMKSLSYDYQTYKAKQTECDRLQKIGCIICVAGMILIFVGALYE